MKRDGRLLLTAFSNAGVLDFSCADNMNCFFTPDGCVASTSHAFSSSSSPRLIRTS